MANYAREKYSAGVDFEISVTNVDKPSLTRDAIMSRVTQFSEEQIVWLTKAPTFAEKAMLFPGTTFLVGADTLQRLLDQKYYRSQDDFEQAMQQIAEQGCRFLAFGRLVGESFASQGAFSIPTVLSGTVEFVPESEFRCDISSTDIRSHRGDATM